MALIIGWFICSIVGIIGLLPQANKDAVKNAEAGVILTALVIAILLGPFLYVWGYILTREAEKELERARLERMQNLLNPGGGYYIEDF